MRNFRLLFAAIVFSAILFSSCDDAGTEKVFVQKGLVTFSHSNLKTLNPTFDGLYVLWLGLGPSATRVWYDLGHFNISAAGEIVDSLGVTKTFVFTGDTNTLGDATVACVSLGYNPGYKVLMSCNLSITDDSISGHMSISGDLAFGEFGKRIMGEGYPRATGSEILATPTDNNINCRQGIWFCDSLGNTSFSEGLSLTPGRGWIMQGWLFDAGNNMHYTTGRFFNVYNADQDGAGSCAGTGTGFNKPGQDFIQTGAGCPVITNIGNGNYSIFITIEPEDEVNGLSVPFFIRLFHRDTFSATSRCNVNHPYFGNQYASMPVGNIRITY